MHPVLFEFYGVSLPAYGILFAAGFLAATLHWSWMARRENMPGGFGLDLGIWVMVSSVVGARLAYVLSRPAYFIENPTAIIRMDQGGMIYYGGFIGATLAVSFMAYRRRIPLARMADFVIPAVPLGHAVGRVGCLLQGCCYGAPTDAWWGITIDRMTRHPAQLLETFFNLALYIILLQVYFSKHRQGRVFALYLMAYPAGRFLLEFLRGDPRMTGLALNIAQELSFIFFVCGLALWFMLPKRRYRDHGHAAPR